MSDVSFVLPPATRKIVGGLKVIYQYANHLSSVGFNVRLYYEFTGANARGLPELPVKLARLLVMANEPRWYSLSPAVCKLAYHDPAEIVGDVIIASDVRSVNSVLRAPTSHKAYFIQGYENWFVSDTYVRETYNKGLTNIVVSKWLKRIVDKSMEVAKTEGRLKEGGSSESIYIPNGIDLKVFHGSSNTQLRGNSIAMLYHSDERKGCDVGIEVLRRLKSEIPDLQANLFGAPKRPVGLPDWITYRRNATEFEVAEIDRLSSVYLCTSRQEGYGLTGLEGMACGCALVTTDCLGIREYAVNGENAVVCHVDDVDEIARATKQLLFDVDRRQRIVQASLQTVREYSIEKSMRMFEGVIRRMLSGDEQN